MSTGAMGELAFESQLDVVAVEFYDRVRGSAPVHRIAVTFRDGHIEFTDVRPAAHHGVADIFGIAIPEAVAKRRISAALQTQYERLRSRWFAQLDCMHKNTVAIKPDPLNGGATVRCLNCSALGRGGRVGLSGSTVWSHVFERGSEVRS